MTCVGLVQHLEGDRHLSKSTCGLICVLRCRNVMLRPGKHTISYDQLLRGNRANNHPHNRRAQFVMPTRRMTNLILRAYPRRPPLKTASLCRKPAMIEKANTPGIQDRKEPSKVGRSAPGR
jgi:hypothetical protein